MWRRFTRRILRTRKCRYVFILLITYCFIHILVWREYAYFNMAPPPFNYFTEADEYAKLGYVVDTPNCHILNISAWDKSVLPYLISPPPPPTCQINKRWTYVKSHRLVINESAVRVSGYSLESISCCYKSFTRVEQTLDNYDMDADTKIKFSEDCRIMKKVTLLAKGDEFIRVFCTSKYWPLLMDVIYRYFHAAPLPHNVHKKTEFWSKAIETKSTKSGQDGPPPSVLLLGIDSMSRLSFQRNMKKTRTFLQQIGAHEMLGYTKLGENTFPNAVAFMMGLATGELRSACNFTSSTTIEQCPFIWKDFSDANYFTSFIEDVPFLATYNYLKVGFVHQPVDFYFRPFMLGLHYHIPRSTYFYLDCIGSESVDQTVHTYIEDILNLSQRSKTPAFIYTWLTNLAHGDLNAAQNGDEAYLDFLQRVDLSNTILFFMSDHGYRYGFIRQTFAGWYEDKLPNFWVYIPPSVQNRFPEWSNALRVNTGRLSSPLDLYATFQHILSTFSTKTTSESANYIRNVVGQSLFEEISLKRRCQDAGIPDNYCACVTPKRLEVNDTRLFEAAKKAVSTINNQLPSQCVPLTLSTIHAGGLIEENDKESSSTTESLKNSNENKVNVKRQVITYIIAFYTNPGEFLFEANVEYLPQTKEYNLIGELLRMNKINTDVSCIKDDNVEKFCYCANLS